MVREQYKYPNVKLIDIDGTVLRKREIYDPYDPRRPETETLPGAVEKVNEWFDQGYYICFFTSRPQEAYDITMKELNEAGFRYHRIIMEKPWTSGTIEWYDDKPICAIQVDKDIGIRYMDEPSAFED